MTNIGKVLFAAAAIMASSYSASVFGPGMWAWIFIGVGLAVLVSVFLPGFNHLARVLGQVSGVLSGLALLLLLVAATVGGSFNMSQSNITFSFMLAALSVLGLSAFFWKGRVSENRVNMISRGGSASEKE